MVLFWNKKLESHILNRTITPRQFMIYSFFVIGSFSSVLGTTRHHVSDEVNNIIRVLSLISGIIIVIQYIYCYKIIKGKDISLFLYSIIPLTFAIRFMYLIILLLPLMVLNSFIIRGLSLEYNFWGLINVEIITVIMNIVVAVHFLKIVRRLYSNNIDVPVSKIND